MTVPYDGSGSFNNCVETIEIERAWFSQLRNGMLIFIFVAIWVNLSYNSSILQILSDTEDAIWLLSDLKSRTTIT